MNFHTVTHISTILTIILAFVYWKSSFRYFFLIHALTDASSLILWQVFSMSSQTLWIPLDYLLVFSLSKDFLAKNKHWILGGLIPILFLNFYSTTTIQHYFSLITSVIIMFVFLRYFVIELVNNNRLSMFFILMLFDVALTIVKFIAILRELEVGINVYYTGVFIQIFIAIVLILIRKGATIPKGEIFK